MKVSKENLESGADGEAEEPERCEFHDGAIGRDKERTAAKDIQLGYYRHSRERTWNPVSLRREGLDSGFRRNDDMAKPSGLDSAAWRNPKIVSRCVDLALERESSRCLKRVTDAEQGGFIEVLPEKLQANGQTTRCLAAWNRDAWNSGQIGCDGEDIRQIHGQEDRCFSLPAGMEASAKWERR